MIHIDTLRVTLPLKQKFVVSKGETSAKTNVLTVINNRYNGEASTSVYYGPTLSELEQDLIAGAKKLKRKKKFTVKTLEEINTYDIHPIAKSALTGAVLNYISGETKRYPWEVLSLSTPVGIKSSFTIGIDDPKVVADAIKKSDYPIIKVKMGTDHDIELIKELKKIKDKEIRVDANGAWSCEKAEEMIFHLAQIGVIVIEQPTDIESVSDWVHLKAKNEDVKLFVDEGFETLDDFKRLSEHIDGVNIKMEKSGGILEAIKIANEAHKEDKKVMLGCMVESSIGIAQSVYMSSLADYHDLDSPQFLEDDIADGINYNREVIEVDREIIGGPKLKREFVEKFAVK